MTTTTAVLTLADEALELVTAALAAEPDDEAERLGVEVRGVTSRGYDYDLYFQPTAELPEGAAVDATQGMRVAVPGPSVDRLRGARLEVEDGGLVLVNPNTPSAAERLPSVPEPVLAQGLDGDVAQRIIKVLDTQINPAIASHGGRADLVAMDDQAMVAYLSLSGGCQGCAMSRATLANGIETSLRDEIPELTGVIDVTDHASGVTPYYTS